MILIDDQGRPLVHPEPPGPDASTEDVVAYLRASAAHNDRVAALASGAFDRAFRRSLRARAE